MILDFRAVSAGAKVAALGGLALILIMSLVDWYGVEALDPIDLAGQVEVASRTAFESFTFLDLLLLAAAVLALALPVVEASNGLRQLGRTLGVAVAILALVAAAAVVFRLIDLPDLVLPLAANPDMDSLRIVDGEQGAEITVKPGLWLALVAAAVCASGGFLAARTTAADRRVGPS